MSGILGMEKRRETERISGGCRFVFTTRDTVSYVYECVIFRYTCYDLTEKSIAAFQIAQKYFDVKKSAAELYR